MTDLDRFIGDTRSGGGTDDDDPADLDDATDTFPLLAALLGGIRLLESFGVTRGGVVMNSRLALNESLVALLAAEAFTAPGCKNGYPAPLDAALGGLVPDSYSCSDQMGLTVLAFQLPFDSLPLELW